jgi:Periplasmic serine proteases (ClpP class)
MPALLQDYLLFLAKTVTLTVAVGAVLWIVLRARSMARRRQGESPELLDLGHRLHETVDELKLQLAHQPGDGSCAGGRSVPSAPEHVDRGRPSSLLDFIGDLDATRVKALREEISVLLGIAEPGDRVLLRLESGGGAAHSYGLAASQLARLRAGKLHLTVAVDRVAASGGYMMACVADRIVAAPFAIIGSIGVVAQLPNFNRWLKTRGIDYELHTAGQHKRDLTLFGENSDAQRAHFRAELEELHRLFKDFVLQYRPALDIERVATGEHWMGSRALELGLVDELRTSDDVLLEAIGQGPVYLLHKPLPRGWRQRLLGEPGTGPVGAMLRNRSL